MRDDQLAWPLITDLVAAMVVEIADADLPDFCFVGVLPGAEVALDYCQECGKSCGMAWVRLAPIREEVPEFGGGYSTCASTFAVDVEMGMVRCHQTTDEDGSPMPMDYQLEKARAQMAEMAAMLRVLLCSPTAGRFDKIMRGYTPIGPSGGCVGGAWLATFQVM